MSLESLITCPRCGADEQAIEVVNESEGKYVATFECVGCGLKVSDSGATADEAMTKIYAKIKWS